MKEVKIYKVTIKVASGQVYKYEKFANTALAAVRELKAKHDNVVSWSVGENVFM